MYLLVGIACALHLQTAAAPEPAAAAIAAGSAPSAPSMTNARGDADTVAEMLAKARQAYDGLEYDKVVPLAEAALARPDISLDEKLDAYGLQGSSLAITADPIDAEKPFRLLLRARPEFDLPDSTPPKILAVFRKVQVEEKAILEEFNKIERARVVATLKILGESPASAQGGRAIPFLFRLRDPQGAVETLRVQYRRKGDPEFISLPLKRDDEGAWQGRIPGEWTANEDGFALEYLVVAGDMRGTLLTRGDARTPMTLDVAAGQVDRIAHPVPTWGFWTAAGSTGAAAVVSGGLAATTAWLNAEYHRQVEAATPENPANGAALVAQANLGTSVMVAQWVGWGVTGLGVVVTGILLPFTNWDGETLDDDAATRDALAPSIDDGNVQADARASARTSTAFAGQT